MKTERKRAATRLPQFSPLSIARMLWQGRLLICVTWVIVTVCAYFIVRRLPNIYEAEAVVLVDSQKIPEKFVSSTVQVTLQDSLNAIKQRVLAGERLAQIIKDFHLYEDQWGKKSPEELMDRLRTKDLTLTLERGMGAGTRMNAFRVGFEGRSPKEVAGVVNRITDLFIHENATVRERRAEGTADFIETQLHEAKKRLDQQESAVSEYKTQFAGELPEQSAALLANLGGLRAQLQGNQDSLNRLQQNLVVLESTLHFTESALQAAMRAAAPTSAAAQPLAVRGIDPATGRAVLQSELLRTKLAALRVTYTDQHPDVKSAKEELANALAAEAKAAEAHRLAEAHAAESKETSPPALTASVEPPPQLVGEINRLKERVFTTSTQLEGARHEISNLSTEREEILKQIKDYENRVEKLPIREQQVAALMRDYDMSKIAYQQLLDRKYSAGMATAMEKSNESERFVIADPAREPGKPIRPKRAIYLAGGCAFGLLAGAILSLALELRKNVFLGEWEVPPGITVLGRIPEITGVERSGLTTAGLGLLILLPVFLFSFRSLGGLV